MSALKVHVSQGDSWRSALPKKNRCASRPCACNCDSLFFYCINESLCNIFRSRDSSPGGTGVHHLGVPERSLSTEARIYPRFLAGERSLDLCQISRDREALDGELRNALPRFPCATPTSSSASRKTTSESRTADSNPDNILFRAMGSRSF